MSSWSLKEMTVKPALKCPSHLNLPIFDTYAEVQLLLIIHDHDDELLWCRGHGIER
ncbi:hypothetical protein KBD33_06660 [Candidatus Gracilibacteria bacterium]|nr:hypothetical protein [Candidatus Gracilibacteria bacterium]